MVWLTLGVVVFVGIHLLPSMTKLRARLADQLGEGAYKGLYSAIAGVGLLLIIVGKAYADFVPLWTPPTWGHPLALIAMFPALALVIGADMQTNMKRLIRHPMLTGVAIWAGVHLLANGDLASLILFGSLGAFAVFDFISVTVRGVRKETPAAPVSQDVKLLAITVVVYGLLLWLHPFLFKMPVI